MKKIDIEFLPDSHTYLANGVLIPSVSELIRFQFPDAYCNIPERILRQKANYGTKVHEYIEKFVGGELTMEQIQKKRIDPDIKIAVEQFDQLSRMWMFAIKDMEQIVTYKGKFAGMYDLRTIDDMIIDIKTTTEIHEDWLRIQLGMYYLAAGLDKPFGYVMWLPKGKAGQVKQINVASHHECKELLKRYEQSNKGSADTEKS